MNQPSPSSTRTIRHRWGILLLCFWILASQPCARADARLGDFAVTRWTHENGLPDNSVTCVMQTFDGFLWIGTAKGLARFDGVRFVPLRLSAGHPVGEKGITALYEDASSRLWIGTHDDGLWRLEDGAVNQVGSTPGFDCAAVTCIAGGRGGDVWVGTTNGLGRFNGTNVTCFTVANGLPSDIISSVHVSGPDTVWITTRRGMCQFKDGRFSPLEFHTDTPRSNPEMIGIYNDQRGNLWAFGDTYLVNLNDGRRFNYFRSGDTLSLRIWSSCEGRDGQLWLGTSGQGVFSFAEGHFRPLLLRDASLGSDVQAIHEDAEGNLWLGTFSSGLLQLQVRRVQTLDASSGLPVEPASCLAVADDGVWAGYPKEGLFVKAGERFEPARLPEGLASFNLITSLAATDGVLWAGTRGLGLIRLQAGAAERLTTENGLADDEILSLAAQADNSIWVGTESGVVHHLKNGHIESFGAAFGSPRAPITCLSAAAGNKIFLGTAAGTIAVLQNQRFTSLDPAGLLSGAPIRALFQDTSGRVWIGSQGKGLAWLVNGKMTLWDTKTGFPDDNIGGLLADEAGRIWVCTRRGIHVLTPAATISAAGNLPTLQTVCRFEVSSLAATRWGCPGAVKTRDGRLWFAGPGEIYILDPRDFHPAAAPFHAELEKISLNGQPWPFHRALPIAGRLDPARPLRFPSHLRTLEIEFTAPCLVAPERLQFQHRLDHFDKDWVDGDLDRRVRYNGLPFGQYQFHVRARNLDGTWGPDNDSLAFFLPPPFWRQPWIIFAEAVLAISVVAALVRVLSHRRLRLKLAQLGQQEAMERERMRIARDMHDEIGSRLTRISYFSELALQEETPSRDSLHSIAHTIRDLLQTLDEIVWAVNPQNDTLENLAAYLGYFVTEYLHNTSVECKLNIPPKLPAVPLTAETRHNVFLAFEEAVSNALRHSGATCLSIDMAAAHDEFKIRVEDNGRGFNPHRPAPAPDKPAAAAPAARRGNGLVNMRHRLESVGGRTAIESRPGQGTIAIFYIPIEMKPKDSR